MTKFPAVLLSSLSACLLPTFVLVVLAAAPRGSDSIGDLALLALLIAVTGALHLLFLGIPAFVLLLRLRLVRWWSMAVAGFLAGCLPIGTAIFLSAFDSAQPSAQLWDSPTVVANYGVPTADGWLFLFQRAGAIGVLGAIAGLAFWLTWAQAMRSNNSFKADASGAA